jgi:tetratricopeptide (TPR) repeat protein
MRHGSSGGLERRSESRVHSRLVAVLVAVLLGLSPRLARAQVIAQAFELERAGRHARAAEIYLAVLRGEPTNLAALLGLERVLPPLGRLAELLPLVRRALAADSMSRASRALEVRTLAALNEPDSAEGAARRWMALAPGDEGPYREWALALMEARRLDEARGVLMAGLRALGEGRAGAFAVELANLAERRGQWEEAARQWGRAATAAPDQLPSAAAQLADVPREQRERVTRVLVLDPSPIARRLGAELLLTWGDPVRAWAVFEPTVAPGSEQAAFALRRFADLAAARGTPEAQRVRALALVGLADAVPQPLAARTRADAARALLDAGDVAAARPVLERIAADSTAPADARALAHAVLLEGLIRQGDLDAATRRLAEVGDRLTADDHATLRRALVRARIRRGELALADSALGDDSSVEAAALRGWVALYRGDLKAAADQFRAAGPYAGQRSDATERTAMLALIQQVRLDSSSTLGAALLTLARGDSAQAVQSLRLAAERLQTAGQGSGAAELLLLAGRIAARPGGSPEEERTAAALFADVVGTGGTTAAAPAAELEWARLLLRRQQTTEAIHHLERLILTYPESAVVPEARRELERAKGAIPKS